MQLRSKHDEKLEVDAEDQGRMAAHNNNSSNPICRLKKHRNPRCFFYGPTPLPKAAQRP